MLSVRRRHSASATTSTAFTSSTTSVEAANDHSPRSLIVNGKDAPLGRYPYFTTLDRYCSGVLIAPDIVLTAGHCKPTKLDSVQLHVGTYYFKEKHHGAAARRDSDDGVELVTNKEDDESSSSSSSNAVEYQEFKIMDVIRHPRFKPLGGDEFRNDFTILKLKESTTTIPYISLNRDPHLPFEGQTVTAMGLGFLHPSDDERPDVLQEVDLAYLPSDQCELAHDKEESFLGRIHPSHMCTFVSPKNDRDACAFDSGGPIIIHGGGGSDSSSNGGRSPHGGIATSSQNDVLVALVSWGVGCADPIFPGVNARVSYVSDWIDQEVCRLSAHPPSDFGCYHPPPSTPTDIVSPLPVNNTIATTNTTDIDTQNKTHNPEESSSSHIMVVLLMLVLALGFVTMLFRQWRHRRDSRAIYKDLYDSPKSMNTCETESLKSQDSGSVDGDELYQAMEITAPSP